jgi:hypothetical protein
MESYAEHEQRDPDLGELQRFTGIRDESWREGADGDAREEVPDDRGEPDGSREVARDERRPERDRDRRDEVGAVGLDEEPPRGVGNDGRSAFILRGDSTRGVDTDQPLPRRRASRYRISR